MPEEIKPAESSFVADLASVLGEAQPAQQKVETPAVEKAAPVETPAVESKGSEAAPVVEEKAADEGESSPFDMVSYLNELSAASMRPAAAPAEKAEAKAEAKEVVAEVKQAMNDAGIPTDWLPKTDEEFDRIMESRHGFGEFVQKMMLGVAAYVKSAKDESVRESMMKTSGYVNQHVQHSLGVQELVREFYTKNPDLVPIRQQVGWLANKLTAAHPEWSYEKLFTETASQARMILGQIERMKPGAPAQPNGAQKAPAFAKPVTNRKAPSDNQLTELQKDIASLIQ